MTAPPLACVAPRVRRVAERHCPGCAWYHGFWPYLRVFGMAASPDRHRDFFLDALGRQAGAGATRVLVSGAADDSMLALVVDAWRDRPFEATVLDRCPTPGVVNLWLAERSGRPITTVISDVVDYAPDESFDVVCTHSFLSQFPGPDRAALVAAWHRLLRPGGVVVTTSRLSPAGSADPVTFTPAQVDRFEAAVRAEAERRQEVLDDDPADLAAAARVYAERLVVHATFSAAEVHRLLEDGGFVVERLQEHDLGGALDPSSGPATNQPAVHLHVVARRG